MELLEKAVKSSSDNSDYCLALALAYDQRYIANQDFKDLEWAETFYKKTLELDENNEEANYQLAICAAKKGMWEECVNYCNRVLGINDKSVQAYNQMGLAMYCNSDYDTAISMYKKAIEIAPEFSETYNNYAFVLEKQGNFEESIKMFKKYIKLLHVQASNKSLKSRVDELAKKEDSTKVQIRAIEEHIKQLENSIKTKNQES